MKTKDYDLVWDVFNSFPIDKREKTQIEILGFNSCFEKYKDKDKKYYITYSNKLNAYKIIQSNNLFDIISCVIENDKYNFIENCKYYNFEFDILAEDYQNHIFQEFIESEQKEYEFLNPVVEKTKDYEFIWNKLNSVSNFREDLKIYISSFNEKLESNPHKDWIYYIRYCMTYDFYQIHLQRDINNRGSELIYNISTYKDSFIESCKDLDLEFYNHFKYSLNQSKSTPIIQQEILIPDFIVNEYIQEAIDKKIDEPTVPTQQQFNEMIQKQKDCSHNTQLEFSPFGDLWNYDCVLCGASFQLIDRKNLKKNLEWLEEKIEKYGDNI